ncbi:MAG: hypothetical protein F4065_07540 [Rhodothermaceae bacterium]|nr:hypothetical protein [Rhodothermaceae bacterium]MXX96529.1 hypothetical protein [Rhodothermaceae bacterium]MXZ18036.1 hypothetical protein [Rhodothermaceae bacterium]MYB90221.1 hypothetical protein [Rhodothermaceae bacterium]MYC03103.1 hypothetical protein [Rhodothermaceae bacterium]
MSEKSPQTPNKVEEFRKEALPEAPKETGTDELAPPRPWPTAVYEDEYKPLPKYIKALIKYGILLLAFFIALNHGSRHARNTLCQWSFHKFCEAEQPDRLNIRSDPQ